MKAETFMTSCKDADLPILIRFLLETCDNDSVHDILHNLMIMITDYIDSGSARINPSLDEESMAEYDVLQSQNLLAPITQQQQQEAAMKELSNHLSCVTLILNTMKTCFFGNTMLISNFQRGLLDVNAPDSITTIELWILYILYGSAGLR